MCTLAILYRVARNTPILLAANREEYFSRVTQYPKIQPGTPRVVCGIDRQAGGTWLGVNQFGLLAAVSNRPKAMVPSSRAPAACSAVICWTGVTPAMQWHMPSKSFPAASTPAPTTCCADAKYAAVVYGGNRVEVAELTPGLHTLTNGNIDDLRDERHEFVRRMLTLHTLDSAVTFLAVASRAFSRKQDGEGRRGLVSTGGEYGTVSSTLLSLGRKIQHSIYQYSPGPPSEYPYDDLSALLRQVLSASRSKAAAGNGQKPHGAKDKVKKK